MAFILVAQVLSIRSWAERPTGKRERENQPWQGLQRRRLVRVASLRRGRWPRSAPVAPVASRLRSVPHGSLRRGGARPPELREAFRLRACKVLGRDAPLT